MIGPAAPGPQPAAAPQARSIRERREDAACILVILAATLAVYGPALFLGRVLLPADIVPLMPPWSATALQRFPDSRWAQNQMHGPIFEYYSWRHYARERLRAGEVPLWNPYELGGNVLLANSQSAALYPPNVLLDLLPIWVGINLVTALHTLLTGLFMFGLLRALRLAPVAALTGALAWMFCGLMTVWTEFQTPTAVLCWLPAALWCWENYALGRGWRWAVFGCGAAVALALLAGHLQFAFYVILAVVLYALWRTSTDPKHRRVPWRNAAALAAAIGFGVMLSAATMLPVVEMGRYNFRAGKTDYEQSIGLRLPAKNLLTLLLPDLYGNPRDYVSFDASGAPTAGNAYFGAFDYIEYCAYTGIPVLVLALLASVLWASDAVGRRRATTRVQSEPSAPAMVPWFVALAAVGLLLALGTPLCALLFYGVPGYRQFNATARALCLFSFAIAGLAACGVQALLDAAGSAEARGRHVRSAAAWSVGAIAVCGVVGYLAATLFEKAPDATGRMVARLLTDQWFGYELTRLARFGGALALTALAVWQVLTRFPASADSRSDPSGASPRVPAVLPAGEELRMARVRLVAWLLPAVALVDLLVWGWGFNPVTDPAMLGWSTTTTDFLKDKAPARTVSLETAGHGIKSFIVPNFNVVDHLREVQGADSLHTRRYHELLGRVVLAMEGRAPTEPPFPDPNTLHVPGVSSPFFDLMNVRYVTTDGERTLGPPFRQALSAELTVWENPRALGDAWVAGNAQPIAGVDQAFERLSSPTFDARSTALTETPMEPLDGRSTPARVTRFSPHHIEVAAAPTGRGVLVVPETYYPGWRAKVDGTQAPVLPVDYILRGVPLGPGAHRVTLTYEPASYRMGLYLSSLATAILAAGLTFTSRRRMPT